MKKNASINQIIGQQGVGLFCDNKEDIQAIAERNNIPVNNPLFSIVFPLMVDIFNYGVMVGKREERSKHND